MKKTFTCLFFTLSAVYYSPLSAVDIQVDPKYLKINPGTKITFGKGVGNGCVNCNSPELNALQISKLDLSGEKKFVTDRRKKSNC